MGGPEGRTDADQGGLGQRGEAGQRDQQDGGREAHRSRPERGTYSRLQASPALAL